MKLTSYCFDIGQLDLPINFQSVGYKLINEKFSENGLKIPYVISETKELGRVARADPLGRASLRVRGMWQIVAPSVAFRDIAPLSPEKEFQAYAIMLEETLARMGNVPENVSQSHKKVPDPNNPAQMLDAAVLEVSW